MKWTRRNIMPVLLAPLSACVPGLPCLVAAEQEAQAATSTVVRGMAVGLRTAFQGYESGTSWSRITRTGHRSKVGFARSRVVIPTFSIGAVGAQTNFADADFVNSYKFRVLLETSFQEATSALGTTQRLPYLFKGSPIAAYAGPGTNTTGYIVSDWLTHPTIAIGSKFGLWTTVENQLGVTSGSNTLPVVENSSSFIQRHEGELTNQIGGRSAGISFINTNMAATAASISGFASSMSGTAGGFTPCMMLIDYPLGATAPAIVGDSIAFGIGEGSEGSETYGDCLGSTLRNAGYMARGINETLGLNYTINVSRGGDGYIFAHLPNAMKYRLQLLKLANPTSLALEMVHNDVMDETELSAIVSTMSQTLNLFEATLPSARMIHALCTPDSASPTGRWTASDASDQTPRRGFAPSPSLRSSINALIRAKSSTLGRIDRVFDPNLIAEYQWAKGIETGKWASFGTPYGAVQDGTHPNSHMAALIAANMPLALFH